MLSNLLDALGFGGLTYGAFVFGGRGAAAFVGGFALLLISYSLASDAHPTEAVRLRFMRGPIEGPTVVRVPTSVVTNEDFAQDMRARAEANAAERARKAEQAVTTGKLAGALSAMRGR